MRWITLTPLLLLLSACIYTEGSLITEPQDIVVSPKVYQLTPWYPCHATDVTAAERQKRCFRE